MFVLFCSIASSSGVSGVKWALNSCGPASGSDIGTAITFAPGSSCTGMSICSGASPSCTGSPLTSSDSRPLAGLMLLMSTRSTMFCPIRAVAGTTTRCTITS